MRERSRCASPQPDYSYVAVGRRWLGPREQGEQRTQRVFGIMREYTQSSSSRAGLGCFVEKKYHVKRLGMSLRGQTRV